MNEQKVRLACPVNPWRPGTIDEAHRAWVNHELFYLSDLNARKRFVSDPLRYCGLVTDPVTRQRFQPSSRSPRFDYQGRPYFFQDRLGLRTFVAIPDSFARRKGA